MPFHPIHLAQTATARGWAKSVGTSAKDAQVINGLFEVATNPLLGTKTVYVTKRAGSEVGTSGFGSAPILLKNPFGVRIINGSGDLLNLAATDLGNVASKPTANTNYMVADLIVGTNELMAFNTGSSSGWYLWEDAISTNFPTFTGDTHTNTVIDGITSTTGIYPGQLITGTGIQAGTRVATITSSVAITTTLATTATNAGITITKEAVAKIIDADFPTTIAGGIVQLDGYFFTATPDGVIYQSALNDPSSWAATDVLNADYSGDGILFLFKIGNYIGAAGAGGTVQYFFNAGNPSGSVLSGAPNLTLSGMQLITNPEPFNGISYCLLRAGSGFRGMNGLYSLTGANTFTRVSDDVWSSIIEDLGLTLVSAALIGNKHLVLIHSSTATVAVAYDPSTNMFSFVQVATAITSGSASGAQFTRASSNDLISWSAGNTWTDETVAYTMTIQTEPQDMNQGMDATDTWIDLLADNEASGTATLDTTDDDYVTWVNRGSFDMTQTKKRIGNMTGAMHNVRAYRLQHSANTGWRAQILRVNFEKATI